MKKFVFFLSTMLLGSFSLTSCGGDDDNDSWQVLVEQAVNFLSQFGVDNITGDASGYAKKFDFGAGNTVTCQIDESLAKQVSDNGKVSQIAKLKYKPGFVYVSAKYTVTDKKYVIADGVLVLEFKDNTAGKNREFTLTVNGTSYEGKGTVKRLEDNNTNLSYISGDWRVVNTHFVYRDYNGDKVANTYEYSFNHGNLTQMADQLLKDHKIDIREDIAKKGDIKRVSFTGYGRWSIDYTIGSPSVGDWWFTSFNEKGFGFSYKWDEEDMSLNFEGGAGAVSFSNYDAYVDLNGSGTTNDGKNYKVWVTFTLNH